MKPADKLFPDLKILKDAGLCADCNKPVYKEDFRNEISIREFRISGLCQKCQDKIFGED